MTEYNQNADKFDSNPERDADAVDRSAPHDVYETGLTPDNSGATYLAPELSAQKDENRNVDDSVAGVDPDLDTRHHEENVFDADEHVFDDEGGAVPAHDEAVATHDDKSFHPVPEGLGEHREGESLKEWLANDLEQTKKDLHIGHDK